MAFDDRLPLLRLYQRSRGTSALRSPASPYRFLQSKRHHVPGWFLGARRFLAAREWHRSGSGSAVFRSHDGEPIGEATFTLTHCGEVELEEWRPQPRLASAARSSFAARAAPTWIT